MKTSLLIATLISAFASTSFADSRISCKTVAKIPVEVLSYSVKSTQSLRLSSDLSYTSGNALNLVSQTAVAQHAISDVNLQILADDSAEIPTLRLVAVGSKYKYVGVISEFGSTGLVTKKIAVTCSLSAI